MNLVIDHGNTTAKVGIFEGPQLTVHQVLPNTEELHAFLTHSTFHHVIVSSVRYPAQDILAWCNNPGQKLVMSPALRLPINNRYRTPQTLGSDRLAAAAGAATLFPGKACLVIDMGTCVNYEFVNERGEYEGGLISPGLQMRFQAMHTFTARLPLIDAVGDVPLTGTDTESCMRSGTINGLAAEVLGIVSRYRDDHPDLKTLLCGGDSPRFTHTFAGIAEQVPHLVLHGLNAILTANLL